MAGGRGGGKKKREWKEGRKEGGERRGRTGGRTEKARLSENLPVDLSCQEKVGLLHLRRQPWAVSYQLRVRRFDGY